MIRKTVVLLLILAAGICVYQGSSPYIEARMEQEHLKQAAFPGNEGNLSEEEGRKGNGPTREETVLYTSPIDFEVLKYQPGYCWLDTDSWNSDRLSHLLAGR